MIIEASTVKSVSHARTLARHFLKEENELVNILELKDTVSRDLETSLVAMQRMTGLTRGHTGLFHVAINPREGEQMSVQEWQLALNKLEKKFGLEGQARTVVQHVKNGREHLHVVWQLTDVEKQRLIPLSHYKRKCMDVSRELEKELGHQVTQEQGQGKDRSELEQSERLKKDNPHERDPNHRDDLIYEDWKHSKSVEEFIERIEGRGYQVAQGDKTLVLMHQEKGEVIKALPRCLQQAQKRAKDDYDRIRKRDVFERLEQLSEELPTVDQVKEKALENKKRYEEFLKRQPELSRVFHENKRVVNRGKTFHVFMNNNQQIFDDWQQKLLNGREAFLRAQVQFEKEQKKLREQYREQSREFERSRERSREFYENKGQNYEP